MANYFKNFPLIDVPGAGAAKNIIVRPKINIKESAEIPFTLTQAIRPDQIADRFYGDEGLDWAIYHANNVIDPHYEVFLDDDTLNRIVMNQYGSLEYASQHILFWKTNWKDQLESISTVTFDSLPTNVKSYYNAVTQGSGKILNYVRKRETIYKNTNIIARYQLNGLLNVVPGQVVTLGVFEGYATVKSIDAKYITVHHVFNSFGVTQINGTNVTFVVAVKNIADTEVPYYQPVSAYQAAVDANELRRDILLVPASQGEVLRKELIRTLS